VASPNSDMGVISRNKGVREAFRIDLAGVADGRANGVAPPERELGIGVRPGATLVPGPGVGKTDPVPPRREFGTRGVSPRPDNPIDIDAGVSLSTPVARVMLRE
jgi:hypothetical protein